jgi:hypothetical protein
MRGRRSWMLIFVLAAIVLLLPACSAPQAPTPTSTSVATAAPPTPTPTVVPAEPIDSPTATATIPAGTGPAPTAVPPKSPCAGLSGQIEVQVLVGPAEVVGLEPVAVGTAPFAVTTEQEPFLIQGGGPISYADVLTEEWGTYEVTLDLENTVSGECVAGADSATLQLVFEMAGEQMVEVEAEGFQGEYPWSGEKSLDVSFPLVEGATAQGEGWALVLHLGGA